MKNYKVFEEQVIEFGDNQLFILQGPNGYGKTSIFEAVEYALTGKIKRITESPTVNGAVVYEENVLANRQDEAVELSLVLENSEGKTLTIKRKLSLVGQSGIKNNPKNIPRNTEVTLNINGEKEIKTDRKVTEKLKELLEIDMVEYFQKLYFISQEDRLSFLNEGESSRKKIIDYLLNIEKEKNIYNTYNKLQVQLNKKLDKIRESIKEENEKIGKIDRQEGVVYQRLIKDKIKLIRWDDENVKQLDSNRLEQYIKELKEYGLLRREDIANKCRNNKIEKVTKDIEALKLNILISSHGGVERVEKDTKLFEYLEQVNKTDLWELNYEELEKQLNHKIEMKVISDLLDKHKQTKKHLDEYSKNLNGLKSARKKFLEASKINILGDKVCLSCGYSWDDAVSYLNATKRVEDELEKVSSNEVKDLEGTEKEIAEFYKDNIKETLEEMKIKTMYTSTIAINNSGEKLKEFYEVIEMISYKIKGKFDKIEDTEDEARKIIEKLQESLAVVPQNIDKQMEVFNRVCDGNLEFVKEISAEEVENKRIYLIQQHYKEIDKQNKKIRESVASFEREQKILERTLPRIRAIADIYSREIRKHYNVVLSQIKIPVFLYTARILQTYKGGLGIFVGSVENRDGGLKSIRFYTKHAKSHDILYTLSSGQLSGFIIAFTLVLNKVYGTPGLKSILIDDPVQTMDDLNIVSFIDILRNDFNDYQIVISTHEKKFSDYFCYRYNKAGLKYCAKSILEI